MKTLLYLPAILIATVTVAVVGLMILVVAPSLLDRFLDAFDYSSHFDRQYKKRQR